MEEGMARTAEPNIAPSKPVTQAPPPPSINSKQEILPMEMYRYFNVNPISKDRTVEKYLGTIYKWASKDSQTLGDSLLKIRDIERKVGTPSFDEHRYTKIYNYIRMRSFVDSMQQEKRQFKENAAKKYRIQQKRIEMENKQKLAEIEKKKNKELKAIEQDSRIHFRELNKLQRVYTK